MQQEKKYSHLKFMGYPKTLLALKEKKVIAPVHIRIKPTNICNHDCWYCAYHASGVQLGNEMQYHDSIPAKKMDEITSDIIEMGVNAVTFSGGGEPLLYKPLPDTVKKLARGGVKVAALTNGSNLKGRVADAFAQYASWIRVSLDGYDNASYSEARGVGKGEFTRLLSNMEAFAKRKSGCVLGSVFIIDNKNYHHIHELCAKLKNIGVDHVKLSGVVVGNSDEESNSYHDPIKERVSEEIKRSKELEDETFSVVDSYHDLSERMFHKPYTKCPNLLFCPVIGADSKVYTCHDKAYTADGYMGSIKDVSFKTFWFSSENKRFINNFNPSMLCEHHCVCHTRNLIIDEFLSLNEEHLPFI